MSVTMVGEVTVGGDDIIGERSDLSSSASMAGGADDNVVPDDTVVVIVVDGVVVVVVVVALKSNTLIGSIGFSTETVEGMGGGRGWNPGGMIGKPGGGMRPTPFTAPDGGGNGR